MESPIEHEIYLKKNNQLLQIITDSSLFITKLEEQETRQLQASQGHDAELDKMVTELVALNNACRELLRALVHETLQIKEERKKKEGELSVEVQVQCNGLLEEALAAFTTAAVKLQVAEGIANGLTAKAYVQLRLQERQLEYQTLKEKRDALVNLLNRVMYMKKARRTKN